MLPIPFILALLIEMDLKSIAETAAGFAGVVTASLEIQRRIGDYNSDARAHRLRGRADELAKFLQTQTQLQSCGADVQLTQQAISSTKAELDSVLKELVRVQQGVATKIDEMSPIRQWLLLFVPARSPAWVLHFGFYFLTSLAVLFVFEFKEVSASKLISSDVFILGLVFCVIHAILLRYWAVLEKRWSEGFRPAPSPLSRRLLWYGPANRREVIARAALMFGLIQFFPAIRGPWASRFLEWFTFVQLSVVLVAYYAWNSAELNLAGHAVETKFPRNLKFLQWPKNRMTWFWMTCFYFMVGCTIFFPVRQVVTGNVVPPQYRNIELLRVSAIVGVALGTLMAYVLPMYALNRILLAQPEQETVDLRTQPTQEDSRDSLGREASIGSGRADG